MNHILVMLVCILFSCSSRERHVSCPRTELTVSTFRKLRSFFMFSTSLFFLYISCCLGVRLRNRKDDNESWYREARLIPVNLSDIVRKELVHFVRFIVFIPLFFPTRSLLTIIIHQTQLPQNHPTSSSGPKILCENLHL